MKALQFLGTSILFCFFASCVSLPSGSPIAALPEMPQTSLPAPLKIEVARVTPSLPNPSLRPAMMAYKERSTPELPDAGFDASAIARIDAQALPLPELQELSSPSLRVAAIPAAEPTAPTPAPAPASAPVANLTRVAAAPDAPAPDTAVPDAPTSSPASPRVPTETSATLYVSGDRVLIVELPGFGWILDAAINADGLVLEPLPQRNVETVYSQDGVTFKIQVPEWLPESFKLVFDRTRLSDGTSEKKAYLVFDEQAVPDSPAVPALTAQAPQAPQISELTAPRTVDVAFVEPVNTDVPSYDSPDQELFQKAMQLTLEGTNNSVRSSLDLLRELIRDYPFSVFYDRAVEEIRRLERRYIMVR